MTDEECLDMEIFTDRLAGFLYQALTMGYDYNNAWKLLLNSKQGRGILERDYTYFIHFQGRTDADKAEEDIGNTLVKTHDVEIELNKLDLLANFVYLADRDFHISYDKMFEKISLNDFMKTCGNILGNYDDKLIKAYLM